ncbi:hypothetical protein ASG65_07765 [Bacillus sp. Leaf13]|nr:hypothetical protein ASG65_07765 [Bacillus sp. Leaf13]
MKRFYEYNTYQFLHYLIHLLVTYYLAQPKTDCFTLAGTIELLIDYEKIKLNLACSLRMKIETFEREHQKFPLIVVAHTRKNIWIQYLNIKQEGIRE